MQEGFAKCHPISADRQATTRLLMRVRRRRPFTPSGNPQLEVSVEGRIPTTYAFTRLADAQFITTDQPSKEVKRSPQEKSLSTNGESQHEDQQNTKRQCQKEPVEFIPIQFLRNPHPQKYCFQRSRQMLGLAPGKRSFCPTVVFHTPGKPPPTAHPSKEKKDGEGSPDVNPQKSYVIRRLLSLLEKKPVWQRVDIMKSYGRQNRWLAKESISVYTYIFGVGPWRNSCIRFGYDPYSDPQARFYQSIEFRLTEGQLSNFVEKYKLNRARHGEEDAQLVMFGKPLKRQNRISFQHIDDYDIQQFILKHPRQSKVNFRWGWFTPDFDTSIRKMLYEKIDWVVQQAAFVDSEKERKTLPMSCEEFNIQAQKLGPQAKIIESRKSQLSSPRPKQSLQTPKKKAKMDNETEDTTSQPEMEQGGEEDHSQTQESNEPAVDEGQANALLFEEDEIEAYQLLDDEYGENMFAEDRDFDEFEEGFDDVFDEVK